MRKSVFTVGLLLAFVLSFSVVSAHDDKDDDRKEKNCQDLLDNNVYRCQVKSDFDTAFEDCFRFTSPGVQSQDFDLFTDGLGEVLGCECKAKGSFKNPRFNKSNDFHCVNAREQAEGEAFLNIAFEGQVSAEWDRGKKRGKRINNGQAVNEFGDSFVFQCKLDPACSVSDLMRGRRSAGTRIGVGSVIEVMLCSRSHGILSVIVDEQRPLVERLLCETISLHGICRAVGVSIRWLMGFMVARLAALPDHLHVQPVVSPRAVIIRLVCDTRAFSKKLANHLSAIKYFICPYNLTRTAALPV